MTNIYAPIQEAKSIYSAYNKAGLLNSNFIFLIPVYTDSGASTQGSNASDKSYNNNLKEIKINDVLLSNFDKDVTEYYYKVPLPSNEVNVTALAEDGSASIKGTGNVILVNNKAVVNIVVTAASGTKKTYVVTIEKTELVEEDKKIEIPEIKVDDVIKKVDVKVNNNIIFGLSPGTNLNSIIDKIVQQGAKASINDSNNTIRTDGGLRTLDKLIITGTSETKSFDIAIRGDLNGDGDITILDLLKCQKHLLGSSKLTDVRFYAADTNYDGDITILDLLKIQKHILGSSKL